MLAEKLTDHKLNGLLVAKSLKKFFPEKLLWVHFNLFDIIWSETSKRKNAWKFEYRLCARWY